MQNITDLIYIFDVVLLFHFIDLIDYFFLGVVDQPIILILILDTEYITRSGEGELLFWCPGGDKRKWMIKIKCELWSLNIRLLSVILCMDFELFLDEPFPHLFFTFSVLLLFSKLNLFVMFNVYPDIKKNNEKWLSKRKRSKLVDVLLAR